MDPQALSRALATAQERGEIPIAIVATAGTTDFGAIDPLPEIAGLARAHKAWFHVDAAYGGGLLVSPRHRDWLAGIEQADSVTIDYHKTWFQPVSCSALVVRDGAALGHVTWHADYLNPKDSAHPNQVDKSLQTTRRFEALKLWVSLRVMGADALGGYLDDVIDLTRDVADAMRDMGDIEIAADPQLSTLVFRYRPVGVPAHEVDRINTRIRAELFDSGRAMVAATKVDGVSFLKFTLLNPKATTSDILGIVELVRDAGASSARAPHPGPRSPPAPGHAGGGVRHDCTPTTSSASASARSTSASPASQSRSTTSTRSSSRRATASPGTPGCCSTTRPSRCRSWPTSSPSPTRRRRTAISTSSRTSAGSTRSTSARASTRCAGSTTTTAAGRPSG